MNSANNQLLSHLSRSGRMSARKASRGFTLIEVMIVVLIIGVLAGIAMASYEYATIKSRRSAAAGCAMEGAQYMERYHTTHMSYNDAGDPPVLPACTAELTLYAVALAASNATTFRITATPSGRQATKDTKCGVLGVNQLGARTKSGTAASPDECW